MPPQISYKPHMPISSCADIRNYFSICALYELNAINSGTTNTGIYTFKLLAYASKQLCLLHQTCMPHCTCNVVYILTVHYLPITKKNNKVQFLFIMTYLYMCQQQVCSLKATCMPHMPITSCVYMRQLCPYMFLIWAHCNQQCYHKHWYWYMSHHWHMPLNKYTCHIKHVCPTTYIM